MISMIGDMIMSGDPVNYKLLGQLFKHMTATEILNEFKGVVDHLIKEYYSMDLTDSNDPYYYKFDRGIFDVYNKPDEGWSYSIGFKTTIFNKGAWINVHNDGVELNLNVFHITGNGQIEIKRKKTFFNCKDKQLLSLFKKELLILLK